MSITTLARKTRLSDKAVRNAVKDLKGLGELSVTPCPGGISLYALPGSCMVGSPADITGPPRQNLPDQWSTSPADITGPPDDPPEEPQASGGPVKTTGVEISDVLSTSTGSEVAGVKETPAKPPPPPRPDIDRLCERLADRIADNGSKRPTITRKWRDACRLLIDKDGRTAEQVKAAIDWCQSDEFWRANILSMPTLREKYDRLRLDAIRKQNAASRKGNGRQPTEGEWDEARHIARLLDSQEGSR